MAELMNISKFSKLTDVSIDTLKHYDRIDLFKPAKVNPENGYRYYDVEQYYVLAMIQYFRSIDMSLTEIKEYLNNQSVDSTMQILNSAAQIIDNKIRSYTFQRDALMRKSRFLKSASYAKEKVNSFELKMLGRRFYYSLGTVDTTDTDIAYSVINMRKILADRDYLMVLSPLGFIIPKNDLLNVTPEDRFIACAMITEKDYEELIDDVSVIDDGYFLCGYSSGSVENKNILLKKMCKYIEDQGWSISGNALIISLAYEENTYDIDDYIYELQIPVTI